MDESSSKSETSESVENIDVCETSSKTKNVCNFFPNKEVGVVVECGSGSSKNIVSNRCASSVDASGPSCTLSSPRCDNKIYKIKKVKQSEREEEEEEQVGRVKVEKAGKVEEEQGGTVEEEQAGKVEAVQVGRLEAEQARKVEEEQTGKVEEEQAGKMEEESAGQVEGEEIKAVNNDEGGSQAKPPVLFNANQVSRETETLVQVAAQTQEQPEGGGTSIGPPPSYSFVMKQKKKGRKSVPHSDSLMVDWPPPPMYAGVRGVYPSPDEGRLCNFRDLSSLAEPIWRSHSQPALCPRCGILILTTTHSHDSIATHVTALALCLFGCWPCCLLPYCMNVCKNTYHHCPICQSFLGAYSPW